MKKIIYLPNSKNMDGDNEFQSWLNYTLTMFMLSPMNVPSDECLRLAQEVEQLLTAGEDFNDLLVESFYTTMDTSGENPIIDEDQHGLDGLVLLIKRRFNEFCENQ